MTTTNATTTTATKGHDTVMRSWLKGLQYSRAVLGSEVPILFLTVMIYVASVHECGKQDMEKALGLTSSTSSRTLQRLSDGKADGQRTFTGLGLIECKEDPADWRYKRVSLTTKGREFVNTLRLIAGEA